MLDIVTLTATAAKSFTCFSMTICPRGISNKSNEVDSVLQCRLIIVITLGEGIVGPVLLRNTLVVNKSTSVRDGNIL